MGSWSTEAISARERFSYWREMVCNALFTISPEAPSERFSARIKMRSSGPLRFAVCESTSYRSIRTNRDVDRGPSDHYTIFLQLRGQTCMEQCDQSFAFQRNDMFISDGRRPFNSPFSDGGVRAMAMVPRAMIDWRAPWLRRDALSKFETNSPYIDLARRHFVHLVSDDLSDLETKMLTDNVCNLLALGSVTDVPLNRMHAELQLEAVLAFCRKHLHDPDLSPQLVADRFGLSLRTLYARFQKMEQTFGGWVLEARLDACSKALKDPLEPTRAISDIAYSYGFNDLSYFNRTFRARFGMSPSQWRFEFVKKQ
jgi:AraC-like DNA-binding protein